MEKNTGEWVKEQLKLTYDKYKKSMSNNTFVLNPETVKLYMKIKELKENCPHKYNNNRCIYCDSIKNDLEDNN